MNTVLTPPSPIDHAAADHAVVDQDRTAPEHPSGQTSEGSRPVVPAVMKALHLLNAFHRAGPTLGVSEIARLADVPKSTAFRLLHHLEEGGYVERVGQEYCLGRHLFELGNSVPWCRPQGLRDAAAPVLSELFVRTQRVVHLAVLEGTEIVYVDKIHGPDSIQVPTRVGSRMSAACSSLGKALLAFSDRAAISTVLEGGLVRRTRYSVADPQAMLRELSRVRHDRLALDREEVQLGLACVAAPVLDARGRAVAAVSLASPALRWDPRPLAPEVQRAAHQISRALQAA